MFRITRPLRPALALLLAALLLGAAPAAAFGDRIVSVHPAGLPPFASGSVMDWEPLDGQLLFTAPDGAGGYSLWKSDGTPAGAELVQPFPRRTDSSVRPYLIRPLGGLMLLEAPGDDGSPRLWRSDGSAAGTAPIAGAATLVGRSAVLGDELLYIGASGGDVELWKTDGSDIGTMRVKDINPARSGASDQTGTGMLVVAGRYAYFGADDGAHGFELWRSDGTEAGTVMVRDLKPGAGSFGTLKPVGVLGERLVFGASDAGGLWVTDGTADGTTQLYAAYMAVHETGVAMGGALYFSAFTDDYQTELWRSDGTAAGTRLVRDINPGGGTNGGSWPRELTAVGDELYFTTCDINGSLEERFNTTQAGLWKSDGSAAGTVAVYTEFAPQCSLMTGNLEAIGDTLYYTRDNGLLARRGGEEVAVKDVSPQEWANPVLTSVGEVAFFTITQRPQGVTQSVSLWRTDGTEAGTSLVQASLDVRSAVGVGDRLFFYASAEPQGPRQLYAATAADLLSVRGAVTRDAGGTVVSIDGRVRVAFEPGSSTGDLTVELRPLQQPGQPTGALRAFQSFTLEAVDGAGAPVNTFLKPYTLSVSYADAELGALPETGLNLAFWDGAAWRTLLPCAGCAVDSAANTVTVRLDHFTEFALVASGQRVHLPLVHR